MGGQSPASTKAALEAFELNQAKHPLIAGIRLNSNRIKATRRFPVYHSVGGALNPKP